MTRAMADQLRAMLEEIAADLAAAPQRTEEQARAEYADYPPGTHYVAALGKLQAHAEINADRIRAVASQFLAPASRRRVRRYRLRITHRACENFGAVDYTIFETITEIPGGLRVETRAAGVCEGERFNDRPTVKDWPGCVLDSAHEYRIRHGYQEVKSDD